MRMWRTWWLVPFAVLNAGCSLVSDGAHVLSYRTHRAIDDSRERHRDRKLAEAAWAESEARNQGEDFAAGFKEGFAEHLFRGTCKPPPLPPARYRTVRNQTAAGYEAAEGWLNGFRAGVADAQNRGLRELVTGTSALRVARSEASAPVALPGPVLLSSATPPPPPPQAERSRNALAEAKFTVWPATELPRPVALDPLPRIAVEPPRWPSHVIVEGEPEVIRAADLPIRSTMQRLIQARFVVATPPVIHSAGPERATTRMRDEPRFSGSSTPEPSRPDIVWLPAPIGDRAPDVVWLRATELAGAPLGDRAAKK